MGILSTKMRAKPMQPNIFTMVVARNACAYNAGFIFCTIITDASTKKVKPVIKV